MVYLFIPYFIVQHKGMDNFKIEIKYVHWAGPQNNMIPQTQVQKPILEANYLIFNFNTATNHFSSFQVFTTVDQNMVFCGFLQWGVLHVPVSHIQASQRNFGIFDHNMMQNPRTPSPIHFVHFSHCIQILSSILTKTQYHYEINQGKVRRNTTSFIRC